MVKVVPSPIRGMDVERAVAFFDKPLDDVQAEAGSLSRPFGGEVRLENFRQHLRRNARPVVPHPQFHQRRGVLEAFHVQQPVLRAVPELAFKSSGSCKTSPPMST